MTRGLPAFAALAGVATLLGAAQADAQLLKLLSPGALTRSHESIEDCAACHQTVREVADGRCLQCHDALRRQLEARRGTHLARRKQRCVTCHADHRGRDFLSITVDARGFDHGPTGFPLDGRHQGLSCEACHTRPQTFRGLKPACAACHNDPHEGALGAGCVPCHTTAGKAWAPTKAKADHRVSMAGRHAALDCAGCHVQGAHLEERVACGTCHKDPHRGNAEKCSICHTPADWKQVTFDHDTCAMGLTGRHRTTECVACHAGWQFGGIPQNCRGCHQDAPPHGDLGECGRCHDTAGFARNTFKHSASRFPLTGAHESVDCRHCHAGGKFNDLKGRGRDDRCLDCHRDVPKHGDFGNCSPCHDTTGAVAFDHGGEDRPTTMPVRAPDAARPAVTVTSFPLAGAHRMVPCQECHAADAPPAGAAGGCAGCHAGDDPHDGQFKEAGAACASCHDERSFAPSTVTVADHAPGRFPLEGGHAATPCGRCHEGGRFVGLPRACADCHLDRHAGRLGTDCQGCHDPSAWTVAGFEGRHGELLTFPLSGPHAAAPCAACHAQGRQFTPDEGARCVTCHADPHGGAFGAACAECHRADAGGWTDRLPFDHRARTGFALLARHSNLACGECHASGSPGTSGAPAAPPPPPEPACAACHAGPHGGAADQGCDDCHAPHGWSPTTFNHSVTGWPLRGAHLTAACGACHANEEFAGLTTECADCHGAERPGDHLFPSWDCGECHAPTAWAGVRFDHGRQGGWALRGAHAPLAASCTTCHTGPATPSSADCDQCHVEGPDHNWVADDCAACHQPTRWIHVSRAGGFIALAHPGFGAERGGLRGAHAIADCASCHLAEGATLGAGDACSDCHAAPSAPAHGADFTECQDCHDPMPGWPAKRGWRANLP